MAVVVEDEWSIRLQLVELFEAAGWETKAFAFGDAALNASHLLNPALLVTDINLPGSTDGLDVATRYRAIFPELPVIYCSGTTPRPGQLVSGAIFLPKPLNEDILLHIIAEQA